MTVLQLRFRKRGRQNLTLFNLEFQVAKLLMAEEDLHLLMEYKQYVTFWDLKTLKEILVLGSNKLCEQAEEIFRVPCRNIDLTLN